MSSLLLSTACEPRWATPRSVDRKTYGGKVAKIAEVLGTPLMPWQQQVADVALEIDPETGKLAHRVVVLTVPRQSGKTTLLLSLWLQRAVGFESQRISWTMQSAKDAREKWDDEHVPLIVGSPLGRLVKKVRKTNGSEAVLFHNGSIQTLMASTSSAGHGKTLDLGIVDEAFAQPDDRLEQAMKPAMITRPEPQMWIVSTAGTPESTWFRSKVDGGRAAVLSGQSGSMAFFEWSAAEDADPGDPETWWSCMPALGHTITEAAIRDEFQQALATDNVSGFRRAYLNQWTQQKADPVIPAVRWQACLDPRSAPADPVVFSWDVTPLRDMSSICVAARRSDGLEHGELVEHRPGVGWVAGRVAELVERWRPACLVVDPLGPAGSLADDVRREVAARGVSVELVEVTGRQYAQGCGQLFDAVCGDVPSFRHRGQEALSVAVDGATKRPLGDAWAWSRKASTVDISPLVALTLARWGLVARQSTAQGVWAR